MQRAHHRVVIVGGGTGGIAVAARLTTEGEQDVAIIDPSDKHYYQPLWTLVGGGRAKASTSIRDQAGLIPKGVHWIRKAAAGFDPDNKLVRLADDTEVGYDVLVVAPGIQLDWDQLPGVSDTLGRDGVSSNYGL
ncbi:MAG: NAD(P)/FAD-dependent oxidoreductase, partial [Planctomycetes bacterium]|nr:NAD(P)/FAD-dependent oxidoreductase [Planctomycetota bacterium]